MYDCLLFDWDGCIVDNLRVWVDVCQEVLAIHGVTPSRDEVWSGFCAGDVPTVFGVEDKIVCRQQIGDIAREAFGDVGLYPGVLETLQSLRKRARLAVVSNTRPELLKRVMERHPTLAENFDLVLSRDDVQNTKPHPEGIIQVMSYFQVNPERTLMIGDSEKDLQAARRAGIDSALFYPPSHHDLYNLTDLMRDRPTYVISEYKALVEIQKR